MNKAYHVLVIDDDEDDQYLIKTAFAQVSEYFIIHAVLDGTDVVENIDNPHFIPDLILLDLNMPRITGFDVLQHLKGSPLYQHIPIIILTTSSQQNDIDQAYKLGANTFITKPISHEDLLGLAQQIRTYWVELAQAPSRRMNQP